MPAVKKQRAVNGPSASTKKSVSNPRASPRLEGIKKLQHRLGNRAIGARLRRVAAKSQSHDAGSFYSALTLRSYTSQQEAQADELQVLAFYGVSSIEELERLESEQADPSWSPQTIFLSHMDAARSPGRDLTPLEQIVFDWQGNRLEIQTVAGLISMRLGWGRQPFIQSRVEDYGNVRMGVDYDSICLALENRPSLDQQERLEEEEELAHRILLATLGEPVSFDDYDYATKRAAAHLIAITQLAEEQARRNPGAAEFARAGLQAIADGASTFSGVFGRARGSFIPAHVGGTREMANAAQGGAPVDELQAGLMDSQDLS